MCYVIKCFAQILHPRNRCGSSFAPALYLLLFVIILMSGCSTYRTNTAQQPQQSLQTTTPATAKATLVTTPVSRTSEPTLQQLAAPIDTTAAATPCAQSTPTPESQQTAASAGQEAATMEDSAPAPAPVGTVVFYEEQVTLATYPYEDYQTDAIDPTYQWPYKRFDIERFRIEAPAPEPRSYRLLVLENAYLKLLILPELGGRIWQVIHKPTNAPIFYQNSVVKPTHWGIENQLGWLALGGIEWGLPVIEHGYDWGVPWGYMPLQHSEDLAAVTVFTPADGRLLTASITISLRAGSASFELEPTLTNLADSDLAFSYWHDAMLAPGTGKTPSSALQFLLPTDSVRVHSTADATLPAPGQRFAWPMYRGRDFSRLGTYRDYLGFFEAPVAHGPFAAVYDPRYDVGVVRVFPPDITTGNKIFSLGWQNAIPSENFTDDDSSYVELHSGLAATFDDRYTLPPGGMVNWRETWYPVAGIGTISTANEMLALAIEKISSKSEQRLDLRLYSTRPVDGVIMFEQTDVTLPFQARPDAPFAGNVEFAGDGMECMAINIVDGSGHLLLTAQVPR